MNMNFMFSLYMYMISCFLLCFFFKHLLLTIISLEFIMILLIFNMFNIFVIIGSNLYLVILFLILMVCEGVLSLSLIVLIVRFYGNDYINSLMILKW